MRWNEKNKLNGINEWIIDYNEWIIDYNEWVIDDNEIWNMKCEIIDDNEI